MGVYRVPCLYSSITHLHNNVSETQGLVSLVASLSGMFGGCLRSPVIWDPHPEPQGPPLSGAGRSSGWWIGLP